MSSGETLDVRVQDVSSTRALQLQVPCKYTIAELKSKIAQAHPDGPDATSLRLVMYGKPLKDDNATVEYLVSTHKLDQDTIPTFHLVVATTPTKPKRTQPVAAQSPSATSLSAMASTSVQASPQAPSPAPKPTPSEALPLNASSPPLSGPVPTSLHSPPQKQPASTTSLPSSPPSTVDPQPAGSSAWTTHPAPMSTPANAQIPLHPVMAAAYNAALVALSPSSATSPQVGFSVHPTPLNVSPFPQPVTFAYAPPAPTVIINRFPGQTLHRQRMRRGAAGAGIPQVPLPPGVNDLVAAFRNGEPQVPQLPDGVAAAGRNGAAPRRRVVRALNIRININLRYLLLFCLFVAFGWAVLPMHKYLGVIAWFLLSTFDVPRLLIEWFHRRLHRARNQYAPPHPPIQDQYGDELDADFARDPPPVPAADAAAVPEGHSEGPQGAGEGQTGEAEATVHRGLPGQLLQKLRTLVELFFLSLLPEYNAEVEHMDDARVPIQVE